MEYVKVPVSDWAAICNAIRDLANTTQLYVSAGVWQEIQDTIDSVNYQLAQVIGDNSNE